MRGKKSVAVAVDTMLVEAATAAAVMQLLSAAAGEMFVVVAAGQHAVGSCELWSWCWWKCLWCWRFKFEVAVTAANCS